jgi:hypothetical protein
MKNTTIDRYRNAIIELIDTKADFGYVSRDHFNDVTKRHKITRALPTYLQRVNVIEKAGKNRFKFIKSPTIGDIKSIGKIVFTDNVMNRQKKNKNLKQMTIETSVPQVNEDQESDDFAAKAMAYLESRGFKVTKEKLNFPITSYKGGIKALVANVYEGEFNKLVSKLAQSESDHIRLAYRSGQSGKYNTPEEYIKNEYNDFAS